MSQNTGIDPCCLSGVINGGKPSGRIDTIGGIQTYIAEPKDGSASKTVVVISDIFGWELPNTRLICDEYAKAGFYTYLPDFLQGDSLHHSLLQNVEPPLKVRETLSVVEKAKNAAIVSASLGPWLISHREAVSKLLIDGFINTLRTIPGTNKIGAIGFCWGGRYAVLQAHGQSMDKSGSSIGGVDAAFAAHPTFLAIPGDIDPVRKPLSIALGGKDSLVDEKTRGGIQDVMENKMGVPHEIRVYEDQVHGFALRGDWSNENDKKAMDEATQQGIDWLGKYLA